MTDVLQTLAGFSTTGQPVGSKALAADDEVTAGPSTIRNELSVLEELGLPYSADAGWIDRKGEPAEIAANLQALEEFTKRNRFALAVGTTQRETIERLITWSKDLEARGLVLAPVTGLTECLDLCAERVRKAMTGAGR